MCVCVCVCVCCVCMQSHGRHEKGVYDFAERAAHCGSHTLPRGKSYQAHIYEGLDWLVSAHKVNEEGLGRQLFGEHSQVSTLRRCITLIAEETGQHMFVFLRRCITLIAEETGHHMFVFCPKVFAVSLVFCLQVFAVCVVFCPKVFVFCFVFRQIQDHPAFPRSSVKFGTADGQPSFQRF